MTALVLLLVLRREPVDPAWSEFTRVQESWVAETLPPSARDRHLPPLVRDLGSPSHAVRERASERLAGLGVDAVPALSAATASPDPEVSRRAWLVLAVIHRCPKCTGTGGHVDGWMGLCPWCQGSKDTRCVGQRAGYDLDPFTGGYVERYMFTPKYLFPNPNL